MWFATTKCRVFATAFRPTSCSFAHLLRRWFADNIDWFDNVYHIYHTFWTTTRSCQQQETDMERNLRNTNQQFQLRLLLSVAPVRSAFDHLSAFTNTLSSPQKPLTWLRYDNLKIYLILQSTGFMYSCMRHGYGYKNTGAFICWCSTSLSYSNSNELFCGMRFTNCPTLLVAKPLFFLFTHRSSGWYFETCQCSRKSTLFVFLKQKQNKNLNWTNDFLFSKQNLCCCVSICASSQYGRNEIMTFVRRHTKVHAHWFYLLNPKMMSMDSIWFFWLTCALMFAVVSFLTSFCVFEIAWFGHTYNQLVGWWVYCHICSIHEMRLFVCNCALKCKIC